MAVRIDGKRFASAGLNNVAKLWEASEGKEIAELKGDRYAREFLGAKERDLTFANNEVAFRKKAFQTATNNHNAQLDRVKKATETLRRRASARKTNVVNATEAKLPLWPEFRDQPLKLTAAKKPRLRRLPVKTAKESRAGQSDR